MDDLRRSLVRLHMVVRVPDYREPWRTCEANATATGCVIDGDRILTCAHCVDHVVSVEVRAPGGETRYAAAVRHIDRDRELALVTVDDASFFDDRVPLELGEMPSLGAQVTLHRLFDDALVITCGRVTRIATRTYWLSQRCLLAFDTDAAAQPGNSGGPAIVDGKLVGLAFQAYAHTSVVPTPIIESFLFDTVDGAIGGAPELGVYWQRLADNHALRGYLGVGAHSGVMVTEVVAGSAADGRLFERDVITAIDGAAIGDDGLAGGVHFTHLVARRQIGDTAIVSVIRHGRPIDVDLILAPYVTLVPAVSPARYVIVGGLVIAPLTFGLMNGSFRGPRHYRSLFLERPTRGCREVIVVAKTLEHPINAAYGNLDDVVLHKVNGRAITRLGDVTRALERPVRGYHVLEIVNSRERNETPEYECNWSRLVVMQAAEAEAATYELAERHGIRELLWVGS